jgi:hypothetical protein
MREVVVLVKMDKDKNKIHIMFLYLEQSKMVVIAKKEICYFKR